MALTETNRTPRRIQFGIRALFVVLTVLAILLAGYGWLYRKHIEPRQHTAAIEQHLKSLALRRPQELTPRQWESAVAWTGNLHANSLLRFQADGPAIRHLEQRLAKKLAGDVNLDTIHWIWDEYAKACPGGAAYQRFRPQMMEEIEAGGGNWGLTIP